MKREEQRSHTEVKSTLNIWRPQRVEVRLHGDIMVVVLLFILIIIIDEE